MFLFFMVFIFLEISIATIYYLFCVSINFFQDAQRRRMYEDQLNEHQIVLRLHEYFNSTDDSMQQLNLRRLQLTRIPHKLAPSEFVFVYFYLIFSHFCSSSVHRFN
jgi:hypothetical protein